MNAGDVEIEAALDLATGMFMSFCLQITPGYAEWCKEQIALGHEIRTITVAEAVDHVQKAKFE